MDTSFWWVNNERLRLPRHKYGTTSNKQTKTKKIEKKTREKKNSRKVILMMMIHVKFVVDLNDSSIFDEFLEYADLINAFLEINLDLLFEKIILLNLYFQ